MTATPLLEVRDLKVHFPTDDGLVRAVDGVSFRVGEGETRGVVGESGSGKSVAFLTVMGLIDRKRAIVEGEILFRGEDLLRASEARMRKIRGSKISMIFQDPMASLHPLYAVGDQIVEAIRAHEKVSKREGRARAVEMLRLVGIPRPRERADQFPHEFSGGMRQRAMIAMALALSPDLLIADEPTTALDVTVQAQILEMIGRLNEELGASVVIITHDLGVVAEHADEVIVMYGGRIAERGSRDDVYYRPHHPYTWGLLRSVTRLDRAKGERLRPIAGHPPSSIHVPSGCPFHPRCPYAMDVCTVEVPELLPSDGHHAAACHLPLTEKERAVREEVSVQG